MLIEGYHSLFRYKINKEHTPTNPTTQQGKPPMPGLPTDEKPSKRHRLRLIFWKLTGLEGCFSWAPALTSSAPSTNNRWLNFTKPSRSKSPEIITSILKDHPRPSFFRRQYWFPAVPFMPFKFVIRFSQNASREAVTAKKSPPARFYILHPGIPGGNHERWNLNRHNGHMRRGTTNITSKRESNKTKSIQKHATKKTRKHFMNPAECNRTNFVV